MKRGVSFEIPQETSNILWQILGCIKIDKFYWYNVEEQSEVWSDSQGGEFFYSNYLDGENFSRRIHNDHYIVFLKLQAYFEKGRFNSIHTYDEFLESDCQMIILIYDCEFVELYLKDQDYIRKIYENAIKNDFKNIQCITELNDGRSKMDIL